jgi:hypothetical protein
MRTSNGTNLIVLPTHAVQVLDPVVTITSKSPERPQASVSEETIVRVLTRALTTYCASPSLNPYRHILIDWAYADVGGNKVFGGIIEERQTGKRAFWTLNPRTQDPLRLGLVP